MPAASLFRGFDELMRTLLRFYIYVPFACVVEDWDLQLGCNCVRFELAE